MKKDFREGCLLPRMATHIILLFVGFTFILIATQSTQPPELPLTLNLVRVKPICVDAACERLLYSVILLASTNNVNHKELIYAGEHVISYQNMSNSVF